MKTFFREVVITIILAVVIFILLQTSVQSFVIVGHSMEPNLHEGERVLISKISYKLHEPERGDIIVFNPPNNRQADYIKRIVGLPGEDVEVRDGVIYINGKKLDEPYIKDLPKYTVALKKIPEDEYFVLGDNRNNSNDSHNGWTVPQQEIVGKTWITLWPPDEWGVLASSPGVSNWISL